MLRHGGLGGDRTHDLRVANAALSQLSYKPKYKPADNSGFVWRSEKRLCQTCRKSCGRLFSCCQTPLLVDLMGFEPTTPTLPVWCAPSCATGPERCRLFLPARAIIAKTVGAVKYFLQKSEKNYRNLKFLNEIVNWRSGNDREPGVPA